MVLWLEFVFCSALIVICGSRLSKYGDVIAEKTGIGRAWIGLILMASITSLPELITGVSSVAVVGVPNIAVGDIMGSCVYNLAILALMDVVNKDRPIFQRAYKGHFLSSGFSLMLISIVLASMMLGESMPSIGHVGLYTPAIIITYVVAVRAVYFYEKVFFSEYVETAAMAPSYEDISFRSAVVHYLINAAIIVMAATWLPSIADGLGELTGLGNTFMGSVMVAMTTSLPEVVVSIAAVRLGAQDMAIANMLGSNMFNILILAVDDILYTRGPIFSHIEPSHAVTGLMAVMMTAVVVIGLTYPKKKKTFVRIGWDTLWLSLLWVLNIVILYSTRGVQ